MTSRSIRQATAADLPLIVRWRREAANWRAARGSDQWSDAAGLPMPLFVDRVTRSIAAGETWIVDVEGMPAGTIAVDDRLPRPCGQPRS